MTESSIVARNLAAAIAARSPEQDADIRARGRDLGAGNGFNAALAKVADITSPQVLSDIISGRTPGLSYHAALAAALGVELAWLRGENDALPPDWSLPPLRAYRRWKDRTTQAWTRHLGRQPPTRDDESQLPGRIGADQESALARLLRLPQGHPTVLHLAAGSWHALTFPELLSFSKALAQPNATHPGHLAAGHALASELEAELAIERQELRRRSQRFGLPPRLFQLTRLALVGLKAQRDYQGKDAARIDDALEILWRQQLATLGLDKTHALAPFSAETGRKSWTRLTEIQRRNAGSNEDYAARYHSDPT